MIRHAWSVLTEKTIIDQETNNLSLDVLEEASVSGPPIPEGVPGVVIPLNCELVSLWYRDSVEGAMTGYAEMSIIAPNGNQVGTSRLEVDVREHDRVRTRIRLAGLPVPAAIGGVFQFRLSLAAGAENTEVAVVPLFLVVKHEPLSHPIPPSET